ncbi:MAG: hypothetical protein M3066_03315 [Actinomycetota bacterium]|nr:hypothetical protein [Actinomycetota bacterium]
MAYAPAAGGFGVNVPEGWARTESGAVVTFTDKFNSVRVESTVATAAPTVRSATRHELAAIRAASATSSWAGSPR